MQESHIRSELLQKNGSAIQHQASGLIPGFVPLTDSPLAHLQELLKATQKPPAAPAIIAVEQPQLSHPLKSRLSASSIMFATSEPAPPTQTISMLPRDQEKVEPVKQSSAIRYRISAEGIRILDKDDSTLLSYDTVECQKLLEIRHNWRISQQFGMRMRAAKRPGWGRDEEYGQANLANISRHRKDFQSALRRIIAARTAVLSKD